jgi:hypothetical protein
MSFQAFAVSEVNFFIFVKVELTKLPTERVNSSFLHNTMIKQCTYYLDDTLTVLLSKG